MALQNSQYDALMRYYQRLQFRNKHEQDARIAEAQARIPRLALIDQEIAAISMKKARILPLHKTPFSVLHNLSVKLFSSALPQLQMQVSCTVLVQACIMLILSHIRGFFKSFFITTRRMLKTSSSKLYIFPGWIFCYCYFIWHISVYFFFFIHIYQWIRKFYFNFLSRSCRYR